MSASAPASVLEARGLAFGWPGHGLFQGLDITISPGVSLVTGADGCGKSALLRLLAGDLPAQAGAVAINGRPREPTQVFWIDPKTEAHDAISATTYLLGVRRRYPAFNGETLTDLLTGFSLAPHLDKPLHMLSAGSRRKVWLSAAFSTGCPVTLIDQPFAALDGPSIRLLRALLQEAAQHPSRAWVLADHEAPAGVPLAGVIEL